MTSIPAAVEQIIKKKPFLENGLITGIINLSALARQIKPDVEEIVGKETNEGAITMALNRMTPKMQIDSAHKFKRAIENMGDIIVRSNLIDYTFINSPTLFDKQAQLFVKIKDMNDAFCTFSQGINETTLVVSSSLGRFVEEIYAEEIQSSKVDGLSSVTIKLLANNAIIPGIYYYIFKKLAWDNINICEVISTTNEFTLIVGDKEINKAFEILMDAKNNKL